MHRVLTTCLVAVLICPVVRAQCQLAKLIPSDGELGHGFSEVLALSGNTLVVGTPFDNDITFWSGSAYVYELQGGAWVLTAELQSSDADNGDRFGYAVAIDGDVIAVGTRYDQDAGYGTGSVYVFERVGGVWSEAAKLSAADQSNGQFFGQSVSVSGTRIAVGASRDPIGIGPGTGSCYVFDKVGGLWTQTVKLTASDAVLDDRFGHALAVEGDMLAVGAFARDDGASQSGAVYIFERDTGVWTERAKINPSDPSADKRFGSAVSLDGGILLIGAPTDNGSGPDSGAAYAFEQVGGIWTERQKITPSDSSSGQLFGDAVDLDRGRAAIGAMFRDSLGANSGAVYLFELSGGVLIEKRVLFPTDGALGDNFGNAVGLSGDVVVAGARADDDWGTDSGSAYVWSFDGLNCPSLYAAPGQISVATGGTQFFTLIPGGGFAGDLYYLVGSASGTSPGFMFSGFTLPLNPDPYFNITVNNPNQPPLIGSLGTLNSMGRSEARFALPPGFVSLAGIVVNHAYGVIDVGAFALQFVSIAAPLNLLN